MNTRKRIANNFGVRIQRGIVALTPEEAVIAAEKLKNETELIGGSLKRKYM